MPDPKGARRRRILAVALLVTLGSITWLRQPTPPPNSDPWLRLIPLELPAAAQTAPLLGPLRLEGAWQLKSRNSLFSGYSALVPLDDGQLLAFSDRGGAMRFRPPGPLRQRAWFKKLQFTAKLSRDLDAEAAARDPVTGRIWIATEASNAIARLDPSLQRERRVWPEAMKDWRSAQGPEAMTRLADGRFVVVAEGTEGFLERHRHRALLFPRDPTLRDEPLRFTFVAPAGNLPTELAVLPDGRVLVLLRRLTPFGFEGRILVADPARIRAGRDWTARHVAMLASPLPTDNFEAMTVTPGEDGRLILWVMSDDNGALFQRNLLLKFSFDPAKLP